MEKTRKECDYYATPSPLVSCGVNLAAQRFARGTKEILLHLEDLTFLDPGCGPDARFAAYAHELGFGEVLGVDIHPTDIEPSHTFETYRDDFLGQGDDLGAWFNPGQYDIVCGNPPFSLAEKFIRRSLELVSPMGVVCFLLRLGFWESKDRIPFLKEFKPAETHVLSQRPSFYTDSGIGKTDGTAYAFFLWDGAEIRRILKGMGVQSTIHNLIWR